MIIFKDMITGIDLFSDSFKLTIEDDFLINVDSVMKKYVIGGQTFDTGANASAEGEDAEEGGDETAAVHMFEFVETNRLEPVDISTKKQLKEYLKKFVKNVGEKVKSSKGEDDCKKFQQQVTANLKNFIAKYDSNSEVFSAREFFYDDYEGSLFILNRAEDGLSGTFTCVKAFLEEEKC